jgi:hypothetical protein
MFRIQSTNGKLQAYRGDKVIFTERGLAAKPPVASHSFSADEGRSVAPSAMSSSHDELLLPTTDSVAIVAKASPAELESILIDDITLSKEDNLAALNIVMQEIRAGSITPTTFTSRVFENSLDDFYYQDKYQYRGNEVVRFGINVWALSEPSGLSTIDIEPIALSDSASETSSAKELSHPSASKKSHSSQGKKSVILPKYYTLEIDLLQKAITCLLDNEDCKTVVVDIFAQEAGELKIDKSSGRVETHAILLYKNPIVVASVPTEAEETKEIALKDDSLAMDAIPCHEIVVIDPSNSAYSAHLAGLERVISHEGLAKIIAFTSKKLLQIYKPVDSDNIGPGHDQYRDCIDISVKLAFGLNGCSHELKISDIRQLMELPNIKQISNQLKVDKFIIEENLPIRIKQTSDILVVAAFNDLERAIKHNINDLLTRFPTKYEAIYDHHYQILEHYCTNAMILEQLLTCNKSCLDIFLAEHHGLVELVGAIDIPLELGGVL